MIRKVRIVAALLLPVLALAYLAWDLVLIGRVPDDSAYESAGAAVRQGWKPGDVVFFSPQWAQGPSPWLAGLDVVTSETVDFYEVEKHPRAWIVASPGGRDPEVPEGWSLRESSDFDGMQVLGYDVPARGKLLYDFRERIKDAKVNRIYRDRREECANFKDERWYCGAPHPWQYVGREHRDIHGAVRDVIWAHALDRNDRLEIRYPAVRMGTRLVVHSGFTQRGIETGAGSPVTFEIRIGGRVATVRTLAVDESGWFEDVVDVSADRGKNLDVTFTIQTPSYKDRQVCFTADAWE